MSKRCSPCFPCRMNRQTTAARFTAIELALCGHMAATTADAKMCSLPAPAGRPPSEFAKAQVADGWFWRRCESAHRPPRAAPRTNHPCLHDAFPLVGCLRGPCCSVVGSLHSAQVDRFDVVAWCARHVGSARVKSLALAALPVAVVNWCFGGIWLMAKIDGSMLVIMLHSGTSFPATLACRKKVSVFCVFCCPGLHCFDLWPSAGRPRFPTSRWPLQHSWSGAASAAGWATLFTDSLD